MRKFNIRQQIGKLYLLTSVGYFQIAGASWVALLAMRVFSLLEIGMLESIFHIVSCIFEIPSGVAADVFGRKKTMVMSQLASLLSGVMMVWSEGFWATAFAIGFSTLSYNLASGTREALAYDSLKLVGKENEYNTFAATDMMLYRIANSTSTLCAGLALFLGFRKAYTADILFTLIALFIACSLKEVEIGTKTDEKKVSDRVVNTVRESWHFLLLNKKMRRIMVINAIIGAVSTLVLFFLQAKLPLAGLNQGMLGPVLFVMGMGAALGSRATSLFSSVSYKRVVLISSLIVIVSFLLAFTKSPAFMICGGFVGAFADDFLEVRTDVLINEMISSDQRATLISVNSFIFSIVMIVLSTWMGWIMA
ncbi:MAG: MFS transporter [Blautia sp.]|nr:MFS transporter [Blautia sp.]